jgi:hypothetical protein
MLTRPLLNKSLLNKRPPPLLRNNCKKPLQLQNEMLPLQIVLLPLQTESLLLLLYEPLLDELLLNEPLLSLLKLPLMARYFTIYIIYDIIIPLHMLCVLPTL